MTSRRRRRRCVAQGTYRRPARGVYCPDRDRQLFRQPPAAAAGPLAPVPSTNAFLYNLFTPQVSISYVPDVFGLNRRTVESLTRRRKRQRAIQMVGGLHHPEHERGGDGDAGRRNRSADRRHPSADRRQHQDGEDPARTSSTRAMPAASTWRRRNRNWRKRGDPAAADQAGSPAARPARRAGRPLSLRRRRQKNSISPACNCRRPAGQPALAPGGAAPRRAAGRSEHARRQRPDRHRHRQPPAQYPVDRQCRQHRAGDRPGVRAGHRLLESGRGLAATDLRRRRAAAPGARGAGRLRPRRRSNIAAPCSPRSRMSPTP